MYCDGHLGSGFGTTSWRRRLETALLVTCFLAPALSASAAPQPKANKLLAIINPQGNFLAEGLGKILHAGPSFGGQLVWNWEFAQALAKAKTKAQHGIDVDIVTQRVTEGSWPKEMGQEVSVVQQASATQGRIRIVRVPLSKDGSYLDKEDSYPELAAFASRLTRFYRRDGKRPNLLYAAYADGAAVAEQLRKSIGVDYIYHPHSLGIPKLKGMVERAVARGASAKEVVAEIAPYNFPSRIRHEKEAISKAVAVIANSHTEVKDQHLAHYGNTARRAESEKRFHAIPPGLKPSFLVTTTATAINDAKATNQFSQDLVSGDVRLDKSRLDRPMLFTYARPVPIKNISELVRAVAMDPKLLESHNVVVLAKPPQATDPKEVHDEWAKLNDIIDDPRDPSGKKLDVKLRGKVAIIGPRPQDDIAAILRHLGTRRGSVHVNPALYEAFGLTVIEAMASGLPVAATQNGGPSEHPLVQTFPPTDHGKMTEAIRKIANGKRWEDVRTEGIGYGKSFDWNRSVTSHLEIEAVTKALDRELTPTRSKPIEVDKARARFQQRERRGRRVLYRALQRTHR